MQTKVSAGVVTGVLWLGTLLTAPTAAAALDTLQATEWLAAGSGAGWVTALATALAWALLGWLAAVLTCGRLARLPGVVGGLARAAGRAVTPRALHGALGLTVVLTGLASPAVAAGPAIPAIPAVAPIAEVPRPAVTAIADVPRPAATTVEVPISVAAVTELPEPYVDEIPSLDWPVPDPPGASERPVQPPGSAASRPAGAPRPAGSPSRRPAGPPAPARPVVVQAGDCLWSIAAASLPGSATPAQVASEWPRWHAANRGVIGPDPDLLRPGLVLTPPPTPSAARGSAR